MKLISTEEQNWVRAAGIGLIALTFCVAVLLAFRIMWELKRPVNFQYPLQKGMVAPKFRLPTLRKENAVKLKNLQNEKLFLCFWSLRYPQSTEALKSVKEFKYQYEDRVRFLLIHVGNIDETSILRFVNEKEYEMPVLLDKNAEAAEDFRVTFQPFFFLIDEKGKIYAVIPGKGPDYIEYTKKILEDFAGSAEEEKAEETPVEAESEPADEM